MWGEIVGQQMAENGIVNPLGDGSCRFGGITDEIDIFDPQRWVREDVSATGIPVFSTR
jgi:hypothetical protein